MPRVAAVLACAAVAVKAAAIFLDPILPGAAEPYLWLTFHDAPPLWAADATVGLLFDSGRFCFGLPPVPAAVFDAALMVATAVEWYACGLVLSLGARASSRMARH